LLDAAKATLDVSLDPSRLRWKLTGTVPVSTFRRNIWGYGKMLLNLQRTITGSVLLITFEVSVLHIVLDSLGIVGSVLLIFFIITTFV
jgi:hypothetical protein